MGLFDFLRAKKAIATPPEPSPAAIAVSGKPFEAKVTPPGTAHDSDFASLEAAEARIARIEGHLADRKRLGLDQSANCDQLRAKLKKLKAFVAALKAGE